MRPAKQLMRRKEEERARWWRGWLPLAVLPGLVILLVPSMWPRWAFMWTLAFTIFFGCKWLTWRCTPIPEVARWRHVGYLVAWPGLDAASFFDVNATSSFSSPTRREWLLAGGRLAAGVGLFYGVARQVPAELPYWRGWVGMVGLIMILHFGAFHLLSCAWRCFGVNARPLMNRPLHSASLSEFWGRRWNTAFRDLTHRFLFRPLTAWLGAGGAVFTGFLVSGLVHDAVISVPAGGGYGEPTLFFVLQALGISTQRSRFGRRLGLASGWRGWLFTMGVLLIPVGLLFHRPFVTRIIVPFMHALEAL